MMDASMEFLLTAIGIAILMIVAVGLGWFIGGD